MTPGDHATALLQGMEKMCLSLRCEDLAIDIGTLLLGGMGIPLELDDSAPLTEEEILALCDEVQPKRKRDARRKPGSKKRRHRDDDEHIPYTTPSDLDPETQNAQDTVGAKALLIEVMKRAASDWVLYRGPGARLEQRKLAEDAFTWLFKEEEGHLHARIRDEDKKGLTSFFSICEIFDLDPLIMRKKFQTLTLQRVLSFGRPPNKNGKAGDDNGGSELRSFVELPPENDGYFGMGEDS